MKLNQPPSSQLPRKERRRKALLVPIFKHSFCLFLLGSESDSSSEEDDQEKPISEESEEEPNPEEDSEEDMDVFAGDENIQLRQQQEIYGRLFKNCVFWLGREVPKESLDFVISSFGGKVLWDENGSEEDSS